MDQNGEKIHIDRKNENIIQVVSTSGMPAQLPLHLDS